MKHKIAIGDLLIVNEKHICTPVDAPNESSKFEYNDILLVIGNVVPDDYYSSGCFLMLDERGQIGKLHGNHTRRFK